MNRILKSFEKKITVYIFIDFIEILCSVLFYFFLTLPFTHSFIFASLLKSHILLCSTIIEIKKEGAGAVLGPKSIHRDKSNNFYTHRLFFFF